MARTNYPEREIQRHSLQTRLTHGTVAIACIWLAMSGLFVFVPALAAAFPDVAQGPTCWAPKRSTCPIRTK